LIAAEPIDIWKGNSEIKIESAETNQINLDDEKNSLFEETQIVKTNIFQENNEDLDFNKVYGLFDPEENDLSLEIWIESDGKVLLEHLKRIEKINRMYFFIYNYLTGLKFVFTTKIYRSGSLK
ncbi:hypothetical protein, partial [Mesonia mobilis]|uniref:hypothetical protein n=1 Tax=Mesonia mobilis TaxID=369791 RepID=UPI0026F27C1E